MTRKKGSSTQKAGRAAQKRSLKQFKAEVKQLKKAGVTNVDLRTVKPTKYWRDKLKAFRGVINGKQVAVKISPKQKRAAKREGKVIGSFAILPNIPGQKVSRSKSAPTGYKIRLPNGVTSVKIPKKKRSETLKQYFERLQKNSSIEKALNRPGTQISFTIHGNRSRHSFADFGLAAQYLEDAYVNDDDGGSAFDDFQLYSLADDAEFFS